MVLPDVLQPLQQEAHLPEGQEARDVRLHHLHAGLAHQLHLGREGGGGGGGGGEAPSGIPSG